MEATDRFELRISPADRERLDALAARAKVTRAALIKQWVREADLPEAGDSEARATTFQADALASSEQL